MFMKITFSLGNEFKGCFPVGKRRAEQINRLGQRRQVVPFLRPRIASARKTTYNASWTWTTPKEGEGARKAHVSNQ